MNETLESTPEITPTPVIDHNLKVHILKEDLTVFTNEELEEVKSRLLIEQIENNVTIDMHKCVNSPSTRSILCYPVTLRDKTKVINLIGEMEQLATYCSGDDRCNENKVVLFMPPVLTRFIDKGVIKKLLLLSSERLTTDDISVAAPPKLQDNRTTMLTFKLTRHAYTHFAAKKWKLNLLGTAIRILPKRDWAEIQAAKATNNLSLVA